MHSLVAIEANSVLMATVDQIWTEYDKDSNGWLDRAEMQLFVKDILVECELIENYTDADFERVFAMFDTDGDGRVSREEMAVMVKKISGF